MQRTSLSAVHYRPIDAAIRWAGLFRFRDEILATVRSRRLPATLDCPRCNELRLCTDRIYDAIIHGELPYGQNGITMHDESLWDSPDLTIRHVDLKRWMAHTYPGQRPAFLFSRAAAKLMLKQKPPRQKHRQKRMLIQKKPKLRPHRRHMQTHK